MTITTDYTPDTFYWPGLCSGDAEAALAFYTRLFGWEPSPMGSAEARGYIFKLNDAIVGGMYQMHDDRKAAGVLPHWNTYAHVSDINETLRRVREAGGKVISEPFDTGDSLMALLEDPEGVRFSVWQPTGSERHPAVVGEPNTHCWTELCTRDTARAQAFYTSVFNWKAVPFEGGSPAPYTIFEYADEKKPAGGMLQITDEMQGLTPQWLPYFAVEDADKSAELAKSLGATACGPMDIGSVGRIYMITDPEGSLFAIIKPLPCPDPQK